MLAGIWELKGRARGEKVQRLALGSRYCPELVKRKGLLKEARAAVRVSRVVRRCVKGVAEGLPPFQCCHLSSAVGSER